MRLRGVNEEEDQSQGGAFLKRDRVDGTKRTDE